MVFTLAKTDFCSFSCAGKAIEGEYETQEIAGKS